MEWNGMEMRARIDRCVIEIHPSATERVPITFSVIDRSTKLPIEDTHSIDKTSLLIDESRDRSIDRSIEFRFVCVCSSLFKRALYYARTRETSLRLKKHKK